MLKVFLTICMGLWAVVGIGQDTEFHAEMKELKRLANQAPQDAIPLAERLLEDCIRRGDRHNQAHVEYRLAHAYFRVGSLDQASQHSARSFELALDPFQVELGIACRVLDGMVKASQHRYDEALDSMSQALATSKEHSLKEREANILSNMSIVCRRMGNYNQALEYSLACLELHEGLNNQLGHANTLNNIGSVYYDLGDIEAALSYMEQSLAAKRGIKDSRSLSIALNNIGTVALELGEYERARDRLLESLTLKRELGNNESLAITLNALALAHIHLGEMRPARLILDEALQLGLELNDPAISMDTHSAESAWYNAQGQYGEALVHAEQTVELARSLGNKKRLSDALKNQAEAFELAGNPSAALASFREAHEQHAQALNEEIRLKTADLQSRIEAKQKSREIDTLKRDHRIEALELNRQLLVRNGWIIGLCSLLLFIWAVYLYRTRNIQRRINRELEQRVAERTADLTAKTVELKLTQHQLTEAAHHAGMAEMAISVLHHIGNSLNSVNTSAGLLLEHLQQTRSMDILDSMVGMLEDNQDNLARFITEERQGQAIPAVLSRLADQMRDQKQELIQEVVYLRDHLAEVNSMVQAQQVHADVHWLEEDVDLLDFVNKTFDGHRQIMIGRDIALTIDCPDQRTLRLQRLRAQRALLGLIDHAVSIVSRLEGTRQIRLHCHVEQQSLLIELAHTLVMDQADQIDQWFLQGSGTNQDMRSGLHNCATSLQEMNGSISAHAVSGEITYRINIPILATSERQDAVTS